MKVLSPLVKKGDMESARRLQKKMGELMAFIRKRENLPGTLVSFRDFNACWTSPLPEQKKGAVIYFHGGGYVAGDLDYAMGFGTVLSLETKRRVICPDYRLAPENPFPAAVYDAIRTYRYLLEQGYGGNEIVLAGESAGGGLIFALVSALKALDMPLPAGLVALSPWTDLTMSGASIEDNKSSDLTLSKEMIRFYSDSYAKDDKRNPFVSPLFADLAGFPPCLIYAGGDELVLSDSVNMAAALKGHGVKCSLHIEPKMWHGYVLYGIPEARRALAQISSFIDTVI